MQSRAKTVDAYLAELPSERREALSAVRRVILRNLDKRGFEEGMQYGMIGYYVPHRVYPDGYHCDPKQPLPFAGLASQKNYMSFYGGSLYASPENAAWFREAWAKAGKQLDMGKGCVRFKKLEDLALDVIGEAIRRVPAKEFIRHYEAAVKPAAKPARKAAAKPAAKAARKASAKPARKVRTSERAPSKAAGPRRAKGTRKAAGRA